MTFPALRGAAVALTTVTLALGLAMPASAAPDTRDERPAPATAVTMTDPGVDASTLVPDPSQSVTTSDGGTVVPLVSKEDYQRRLNDISIDVNWWGVQVKFSRTETITISAGASACLALIDRSKIPARAKPIIRAACAVLTTVADWAIANGRCLAHNSYYIPPGGHPWTWDC